MRIKEITMESNVLCLSRYILTTSWRLPNLTNSLRISHYNASQQILNVYVCGGQTEGSITLWDTRKQKEVERFGHEKNQGTIRLVSATFVLLCTQY